MESNESQSQSVESTFTASNYLLMCLFSNFPYQHFSKRNKNIRNDPIRYSTLGNECAVPLYGRELDDKWTERECDDDIVKCLCLKLYLLFRV